MNEIIYLDNAATTRPTKKVIDKMTEVLKNCYGNPSSLHNLGLEAENIMTSARKVLADSISASDSEIYFTPNGTIANNAAILGFLKRNRKNTGNRILCSSVEHASVYDVFEMLASIGYEVLEIPVKDSSLDYDFIYNNVDLNTALISVMAVNNETGTVFDISKIRDILNRKRLNTIIHSDLIQGFMKIPVDVWNFGADILTFSAHKIGGPKGIGGLYIRKGILTEPIYYGGGQEKNMFSGTENVAAIAGFSAAIENFAPFNYSLYDLFLENLNDKITINSKNNIKNILNISLDIRSEIALHMLESKGIFVSSGSACSQKKGEKNRVLKSFGINPNKQDTALRFSFSADIREDDILKTTDIINNLF